MSFGDSNGGMYMPVAPAGYGGYGNGGFGMGDNCWWILVLLLALGGGWNNGWGMNGGGMFPLYQQNTNNDVQRGFDQQAVMGGINTLNSNVSNGFATTQQAICNSTAGITQAVNNGFASAEISNNARQIANMQQDFASQTAITGGINNLGSQLAQCCCDNRLATANLNSTILSENCADRAALNDGVRDIIANQNAGFQSIKDMMCQNQIDALQRENTAKDVQIAMLGLKADNLANRDAILSNNDLQTATLIRTLDPTPVPAYPAQYPQWNYGNYGGCGCNNYSRYAG